MVRDPVELFISNFYYLRNGFQKTANKNSSEWTWNMSEDKRSQTIEDCIHAKGYSFYLTKYNILNIILEFPRVIL